MLYIGVCSIDRSGNVQARTCIHTILTCNYTEQNRTNFISNVYIVHSFQH